MSLTEKGYDQLCQSYRAIDDFRSKLLGVLPAATGGAILLTSKVSPDLLKYWSTPIGIFGFLITCGLFTYEIYGIEKCAELIRAGKKLEISGEVHGQFCSRPNAVGDGLMSLWLRESYIRSYWLRGGSWPGFVFCRNQKNLQLRWGSG